MVKFDDKAKRVQLSLMGPAIFNTLQEPEISDPVSHSTKWRSEYPSFVIEGRRCVCTHAPPPPPTHTHTAYSNNVGLRYM